MSKVAGAVFPSAAASWWKPWMGYTLAAAGFAFAALGYFNVHFSLGLPEKVFNRHSEVAVIVLYGIPTILLTRDRYQKIRLSVLITLVFTLWFLVPTLWPFNVDWFGTNRPWDATFPSWEVPGTWTNVGLFAAALLFGRRVKCGWMNTCVAFRETAAAPFRKFTPRTSLAHWLWRLRFLTSAFYVIYFALLFGPKSAFTDAYFYWFWTMVITMYFGSLLFSPLLGNRVWCRWLCPMPFTWANVLGFFRLRVDRSRCTECGLCEEVCDFGLPIRELSKKNPMIRTTQCMGCGRCRTVCPRGAISFYDVRDFVREKILKKPPRNQRTPAGLPTKRR